MGLQGVRVMWYSYGCVIENCSVYVVIWNVGRGVSW